MTCKQQRDTMDNVMRLAGLELLRRELAIAESNATERSDPASNMDNDECIRVLREKIAELSGRRS